MVEAWPIELPAVLVAAQPSQQVGAHNHGPKPIYKKDITANSMQRKNESGVCLAALKPIYIHGGEEFK